MSWVSFTRQGKAKAKLHLLNLIFEKASQDYNDKYYYVYFSTVKFMLAATKSRIEINAILDLNSHFLDPIYPDDIRHKAILVFASVKNNSLLAKHFKSLYDLLDTMPCKSDIYYIISRMLTSLPELELNSLFPNKQDSSSLMNFNISILMVDIGKRNISQPAKYKAAEHYIALCLSLVITRDEIINIKLQLSRNQEEVCFIYNANDNTAHSGHGMFDKQIAASKEASTGLKLWGKLMQLCQEYLQEFDLSCEKKQEPYNYTFK